MKKYLIINADDFGVSHSVNKAIIELLNKGRISSATIMPNVNNYDEAAEWAKNNSNNIGLHLTFLNDDCKGKYKSLSNSKSITDEKGYLFADRMKFSKNLKLKEIKKEIDLQFLKLKESGINISHVDIHRYALYPTYNLLAYLYLCRKCNKEGKLPIRWSRNGSTNVGDGIPSLCDSDNVAKFFSAVSDLYELPIPDFVFKFPYRNTFITYEQKKEAFINMIRKLPEGISEVHIHPSVDSDEVRRMNPTWKERVAEYELMLDSDVERVIKEYEVELISYKDIQYIKRKQNKGNAIRKILLYGAKYILKTIKKEMK